MRMLILLSIFLLSSASSISQVFAEIKQIPPKDKKDKTWTGDGYVRVKNGSKFEFTMVRVPHSGNYDVVIRYKVEVSVFKTVIGCVFTNFSFSAHRCISCNIVIRNRIVKFCTFC